MVRNYRYLGDRSATPADRKIGLYCHDCEVHWIGCQDAAECPECESTKEYESFLDMDRVFRSLVEIA